MVSKEHHKGDPPKKAAEPVGKDFSDMSAEERRGESGSGEPEAGGAAPRVLTPEARRALAEAEERRQKQSAEPKPPREVGGRNGPDPTRFGDWEKGGITSDF